MTPVPFSFDPRGLLSAYQQAKQGLVGFGTGDNPLDSVRQAYRGFTGQEKYDIADAGFIRHMEPGQRGYGTAHAIADTAFDPITAATAGVGAPLAAGLRHIPRGGKIAASLVEPIARSQKFGGRFATETAVGAGAIRGMDAATELVDNYNDNPYINLGVGLAGGLVGGGAAAVSNQAAGRVFTEIFDPEQLAFTADRFYKMRALENPDVRAQATPRQLFEADVNRVNTEYMKWHNRERILSKNYPNVRPPEPHEQFGQLSAERGAFTKHSNMFGADLVDFQTSYQTAQNVLMRDDPISQEAARSAEAVLNILDEVGLITGGSVRTGIDESTLITLLDDNYKRSWSHLNGTDLANFPGQNLDNRLYQQAVAEVFDMDPLYHGNQYLKEIDPMYGPELGYGSHSPNPMLRSDEYQLGDPNNPYDLTSKFSRDLILSIFLGDLDTITTTGLKMQGAPMDYYKFYTKKTELMGLHESKGPGRILNTGSTLPWISTEKFGGDLGLEEFLSDKQGKWSEILFHEDSPIVRSHDELMSTIPPGARHAQMEAWEGTVDEEAIFYINQLVRNQQDWWLDARGMAKEGAIGSRPSNYDMMSGPEMMNHIKNIYKGIIKSEYDTTQQILANYGYKKGDTITLFRGIDNLDPRMSADDRNIMNRDLENATYGADDAITLAGLLDDSTYYYGRAVNDFITRLMQEPTYHKHPWDKVSSSRVGVQRGLYAPEELEWGDAMSRGEFTLDKFFAYPRMTRPGSIAKKDLHEGSYHRYPTDTRAARLGHGIESKAEMEYRQSLSDTAFTKRDVEPEMKQLLEGQFDSNKRPAKSPRILNPASSWSLNFNKAFRNFARGDQGTGIDSPGSWNPQNIDQFNPSKSVDDPWAHTGGGEVLVAQVPVEDIISLPMLGRGTNFESEIVVRNNPDFEFSRLNNMRPFDLKANNRRLSMHANMGAIIEDLIMERPYGPLQPGNSFEGALSEGKAMKRKYAPLFRHHFGLVRNEAIPDKEFMDAGQAFIHDLQERLVMYGYPPEFLPNYMDEMNVPASLRTGANMPDTDLVRLDRALETGDAGVFWAELFNQQGITGRNPVAQRSTIGSDTAQDFMEFVPPTASDRMTAAELATRVDQVRKLTNAVGKRMPMPEKYAALAKYMGSDFRRMKIESDKMFPPDDPLDIPIDQREMEYVTMTEWLLNNGWKAEHLAFLPEYLNDPQHKNWNVARETRPDPIMNDPKYQRTDDLWEMDPDGPDYQ